jgi:hypothetical protein
LRAKVSDCATLLKWRAISSDGAARSGRSAARSVKPKPDQADYRNF